MYKKERSSREPTFPQRRRTPSFSSSLLDAIYRSIDGEEEQVLSQRRENQTMGGKKQSNSVSSTTRRVGAFLEEEMELEEKEMSRLGLGRAIMIESWVEKRSTRRSGHYNSASSSSDSSSAAGSGGGGMFSSSETESSTFTERSRRRCSSSSSFTPQRTTGPSSSVSDHTHQKPKCEGGGFAKTKLRALKIYGELKKVKQPISPGGRIANFINSIFNSGSAKKVKMCSIGAMEDVSYERQTKSACSSVPSFSRSCLSKTPPPASSRGKSSNGEAKRSVRFYPVSVIVDEDSRPCGHKCIYEADPGLMTMPQKMAKTSSLKRGENIAKGTSKYTRGYQEKNAVREYNFRGFHSYVVDESDEEDGDYDEDDDESCSSSDLFELDHLSGIGRYREELPVYETTDFKTNQAIANGFII